MTNLRTADAAGSTHDFEFHLYFAVGLTTSAKETKVPVLLSDQQGCSAAEAKALAGSRLLP